MYKIVQFEEFFKYHNLFYAAIGLESCVTPKSLGLKRSYLMALVFWINYLNMHLVLCGEIVHFVTAVLNESDKFLEALMSLSYIGFVSVGSFKTFIVWRKKSALISFIQELKNIFPTKCEIQQKINLPKYLKECERVSILFASLYLISVSVFNCIGNLQYLIESKIYKNQMSLWNYPTLCIRRGIGTNQTNTGLIIHYIFPNV